MPQPKDGGLQFHPKAGAVLMCDYRGCIHPEINKRRPVVVITPRLPHRDHLVMVVPLSTTAPNPPQDFHVRLSTNYVPGDDPNLPVWAKCDLISSVSMKRLDRFMIRHRHWHSPDVSAADLLAVRKGVVCALGFPGLTAHM